MEIFDETNPRKPVTRKAKLLFTSGRGNPIQRTRRAYPWKKAVEAVDGVPEGFGYHGLRHYFTTLLIHGGASVKTVQMALGHATPIITITGQVVGGLVLTAQAAAGDLWLPDGSRVDLAEVVIPSGNLIRLRPRPARAGLAELLHDRQARLFGQLGQESLGRLRVAVVGLGGVGSILVEFLARLGVGSLLLIDDDIVNETNLPRLLAAERGDIGRPKTLPAVRNARRAYPGIGLTVLAERVETSKARQLLNSCDWIFLAADSHSARYWVNAAANQYLIPTTQIGVKIPVNDDGVVGEIHAVNRFIVPGSGCMWCNGLIDPTELAIDMQPERERAAARYVAGVPAPSVIALNGLVATEAINHFMLAVTGMHHDSDGTTSTIHLPRRRERTGQMPRRNKDCPWCSRHGHLGRGDS